MFHRHDTRSLQPAAAEMSHGGAWQVAYNDYEVAIHRGLRMRSEMARELVGGLGRAVAGLFRR